METISAFAEQRKRTCSNCTYFESPKAGPNGKCCHPDHGGKMEPVYGMLSGDITATDMRAASGQCGPEGRLFVR